LQLQLVLKKHRLFTTEDEMGLFDKIKSAVSGAATGPLAEKLTALAEGEVLKRAMANIKAESEGEAKAQLKKVCMDVANEKIAEINDPTGLLAKNAQPILNDAADKLVDKIWDKVKDKIVTKKA
jgi:hypothetical protein